MLPSTERATYERINRHKTRDVINTYVNVTVEDLFSNAPTLAKNDFATNKDAKQD